MIIVLSLKTTKMAKANSDLIVALRNTISKLKKSENYQWGHMGSCNCGFLAQEVTKLSKADIHNSAMQKYGDWNDQLNDYCPTSGLLMDHLITQMLNIGFDTDDLKNLEKLSDQKVLAELPFEKRNLRHNKKEDVIIYLSSWVRLLEKELVEYIELPENEDALA